MNDINDIPFKQVKYPDDYIVIQDDRPTFIERKIDIDFDEAEKAWRCNKVKSKNTYWRYGCIKPRSNGKLCRKPLVRDQNKYCKYHFNQAFVGINISSE